MEYCKDSNVLSPQLRLTQTVAANSDLPMFKACVEEAKPASVMCSLNSVNGVPSCANPLLQNKLLRDRWGFTGFVVSDCGAIGFVQETHNFTATPKDTTAAALLGGTDLECGGPPAELTQYLPRILGKPTAVGTVQSSDIDRTLRRVLTQVVRLGELDPASTVSYKQLGPEVVDSPRGRAVALRAAQESIVLLENRVVGGRKVLPLRPSAKVVFLGPHANSTQALLGDYHAYNPLIDSQSPLMCAVSSGLLTEADYAPGCDIDVPELSMNDTAIAAAAAKAQSADVAVLFLGICGNRDLPGATSVLPHLPASSCGRFFEAEEADRESIEVPPVQRRLFDAVVAVQPATVVVLVNGGSLGGLADIGKRSPGLIEAFCKSDCCVCLPSLADQDFFHRQTAGRWRGQRSRRC